MFMTAIKVFIGAMAAVVVLMWVVSCGYDWDKKDCAQLAVELETRTKFVRGKCHVLPVVIVRE